MKKEDIIRELVSALNYKAEFALVFGSILGENFGEQSDVDTAVYLKAEFKTFEKQLAIRTELNILFKRDIDLIFLNDADIIITMQALANGKLVINNNPPLYILFKARKMDEYLDFKLSRKIIEENMLKGRIYA